MSRAVVIMRGTSGLVWYVVNEGMVARMKRNARDDGMPVIAVVRLRRPKPPEETPDDWDFDRDMGVG